MNSTVLSKRFETKNNPKTAGNNFTSMLLLLNTIYCIHASERHNNYPQTGIKQYVFWVSIIK